MVSYVEIKGFEDFAKYTENIDPKGPPVFFFFSGSKLSSGESWCPDCVEEISRMPPKNLTNKKNLVTVHNLNSYEEFTNYINNLPNKSPDIYFLFTGKKKENGRSWCIYCQMAEPVVKSYLGELQKSLIFVYVDVGDREYWKDKACPFRTDSRTRLMVIPTLVKWKGVQRLEGSQCNKRDLLQMLFEEEE